MMTYHRIWTVFTLFLLTLFISGTVAYAQETVIVRTGEQDNYSRIVFEWPQTVPYSVTKNAGTLAVSFQKAASLNQVDQKSPNSIIDNIRVISQSGTSLDVAMTVPEQSRYRHFRIGSRVIIDVYKDRPGTEISKPTYTPTKQSVQTPQKQAPVPGAKPETVKTAAHTPAKEPEDHHEEPAHKETTHDEPVDQHAEDHEEDGPHVEAAPAPVVEEEDLNTIKPHIITITAIDKVGLAVFRRNNTLWIIVDRPYLNVPPQLIGPQTFMFPAFEKHDLRGGLAYKLALPEDMKMNVYGEGGGLVWRIVLTPEERKIEPVRMRRNVAEELTGRGGTASWPLQFMTKIFDVPDPAAGDMIKVITVEQSSTFTGPGRDFVDFSLLETYVGFAMLPKSDDVQLKLSPGGVEVSSDAGLALSLKQDINRRVMRENVRVSLNKAYRDPHRTNLTTIFRFNQWYMGGFATLDKTQRVMFNGLAGKGPQSQAEDILVLAKMNLANGFAHEARGMLILAADIFPQLDGSPEYLALVGAADAMSDKYELALKNFLKPLLMRVDELNYWRAYTYAGLEDWQRAIEVLPDDFGLLVEYPLPLLEKLGIKLAEVALRSGEAEKAEGLLDVLDRDREKINPATAAGIDYLRGEAYRQKGEYGMARSLWQPLSMGTDDFYRARSGLALTMLEMDRNAMHIDKAIDRLEGLRFAWRGDELEANVNFLLGKLYIEKGNYMKGFYIMRDAVGMSPDSDISRVIASEMAQSFKDLLIHNTSISPVDAVTVFEEFRELTPGGEEGDKLIQVLAERLVDADLLGRATKVLQHQVDHRLEGADQARVAMRLTAIYLLDKKPEPALKSLKVAHDYFEKNLEGDEKTKKLREVTLLQAKALSQVGRTERAVEILNALPPGPEINHLRADIAWSAGMWGAAAAAFKDILLDEDIERKGTLTDKQTEYIMNYAVALNLAADRVSLANIRRRYGELMDKTHRGRLFDVVTRPRKVSILSNQEALDELISEVDMFKGFLDSYRSSAEE